MPTKKRQNGFRWIDQVSVKEHLKEIVSMKQAFSMKTTSVKAINKSSHLKVIGQHFLFKIYKKTCKRSSSLVKLQLVKNSLQL